MEKQKPAHVVRIGTLKATIWANDTQNGTRHNVTVRRLYKKDANDPNWSESDSFGRDDLLTVAKLLDLAHTWILEPPPSA
jgi:hypothetical protein